MSMLALQYRRTSARLMRKAKQKAAQKQLQQQQQQQHTHTQTYTHTHTHISHISSSHQKSNSNNKRDDRYGQSVLERTLNESYGQYHHTRVVLSCVDYDNYIAAAVVYERGGRWSDTIECVILWADGLLMREREREKDGNWKYRKFLMIY